MNLNKICPHCEVEYLPHIERCADCGVLLLRIDEFKQTQRQKNQLLTTDIQNGIAIREGDLNWLSSLRDVLIDAGIPSRVITDAACKKGCRGSTCRLVVSKEDTERAQACITEYYMELHPELRVSHDLMNQGKCPACGSPVGPNDKECLDCGLPLVIIEEEAPEEDSS